MILIDCLAAIYYALKQPYLPWFEQLRYPNSSGRNYILL